LGDLNGVFNPFVEPGEEIDEEPDMEITEEHVRIHIALGELDALPT